ncbi:MAG TPA: TonB-dependent receptor plug domain-containing protein, partial [Cyclobacteriaceae bacterium]
DNSQETFDIVTDDAGRFKRNLLFNDTLNFYVKAVSYNNKKGTVMMDTLKQAVPSLPLDPFPLSIYSTGKNRNADAAIPKDVTVLKEVPVEGKKIDKPQAAVIHGVGDYTISGDWINDRNFVDVFFAIVANVPGAQYDPAGPTFQFVTSTYSSFQGGAGGGGPLILVDGVTMTESQVRTVPVRSIDRIDVLKYGGTATYGVRGANGVIAIFTKTGVSTAPPPDPSETKKMALIKWPGYSPTTKYFASYYKETIYWSPIVITDGQEPTTISFPAADVPATYRIVVEGVTLSGAPLRAEKLVEVVKGH